MLFAEHGSGESTRILQQQRYQGRSVEPNGEQTSKCKSRAAQYRRSPERSGVSTGSGVRLIAPFLIGCVLGAVVWQQIIDGLSDSESRQADPYLSALERLDHARGVPTFPVPPSSAEPALPIFCTNGVDPDACRSISISVWEKAIELHRQSLSACDAPA